MRFLFVFLHSCLFILLYSYSAIADEKRFALLIGNEAYSESVGRLKNPINDVNLIASSLREIGFKNIKIIANADRITILDEVDAYAERLAAAEAAGNEAIGFFYYSGHGASREANGRNYLLPVNIQTLDRRLWRKSVALDEIIKSLNDISSKAFHFVVFDACRNKLKLPTKGRKGFSVIPKTQGMMIGFSSAPGTTASDGGDNSGPYAKELARELKREGQDHLHLFQNVKEAVFQKTGKQVPWESNGLLERVFFAGKQTPDEREWAKINDSENIKDFTSFLEQYPKSSLAKAAKFRRKELEEKKSNALAEKEWREIEATKDTKILTAYIKRYPKSIYLALAKFRIKELIKEEKEKKLRDELKLLQNDKENLPIKQHNEEEVSLRELSKSLQRELKRVGCYTGAIDGSWGRFSRLALKKFNNQTGSKLDLISPTKAAEKSIRAQKGRVCAVEVPSTIVQSRPDPLEYSRDIWARGSGARFEIKRKKTKWGVLRCNLGSRTLNVPRRCSWE